MVQKERITKARGCFSDALSLRIFDKRVEMGDNIRSKIFPETLELLEDTAEEKERFARLIPELRDPARETWIYGAGGGCRALLFATSGKALGVRGIAGIIDNHVTGERYGLPVLSFAEFLKEHEDVLVLNSVGAPAGKEIHRQCVDAGVEVMSLFEYERGWDQYFDLPAKLGLVGEGEVFVHAGCFNGDTQKSYINWFGDTYEKMITFEPSEEQYLVCAKLFETFRDVELVKAGLSDRAGTVRFDLKTPGASFISETGTEEIQTVSLDAYMNGGKVTFLALDVEGEEYKALKGAETIIRTQKPKLAVSIYHKPEDMYELPELIKELRPDYRLYLRHYHLLDMAETVLYAF